MYPAEGIRHSKSCFGRPGLRACTLRIVKLQPMAIAVGMGFAACGELARDNNDASATDATVTDVVIETTNDAVVEACSFTTCGSACVALETDPKNCGKCGHDCLGGTCASGVCQPFQLATGLTIASTQLTLIGPYLYWTGGQQLNSGAVYRVSTDGGNVTTLAAGLSGPPTNVASDGTNVYFAVGGTGASSGAIMSLPLDADGGQTPLVLYPAQDDAYAVAVRGNNVYWTNRGFSTTPSVNQAPKNGTGPIVPLATGIKEPLAIAVDDAFVYWALDADPGGVQKAPIDGGAVVPIAAPKYPNALVLRGNTLYFTDQAIPAIQWMALDGSTPTSVTTITMIQLAVSDDSVYFTHANLPGSVNRVSLDAGTVTKLVSVQHEAFGVAEDATAIYWTQWDDGTLMKLAK